MFKINPFTGKLDIVGNDGWASLPWFPIATKFIQTSSLTLYDNFEPLVPSLIWWWAGTNTYNGDTLVPGNMIRLKMRWAYTKPESILLGDGWVLSIRFPDQIVSVSIPEIGSTDTGSRSLEVLITIRALWSSWSLIVQWDIAFNPVGQSALVYAISNWTSEIWIDTSIMSSVDILWDWMALNGEGKTITSTEFSHEILLWVLPL